jgi:hypothetical protein
MQKTPDLLITALDTMDESNDDLKILAREWLDSPEGKKLISLDLAIASLQRVAQTLEQIKTSLNNG